MDILVAASMEAHAEAERAERERRENDDLRERRWNATKAALKLIAKNFVICSLLLIYTVVGGYMFVALEQPNEKEVCFTNEGLYNSAELNAAESLLQLSYAYSGLDNLDGWLSEIQIQVDAFSSNVVRSLQYDGKNCSALGQTGGPAFKWNLMAAMLFCVTVHSTVGYGNIAPVTQWGRISCIGYAVIGIPIMFVCLANIGEIMAHTFRFVYLHVFCCGACLKPEKEKKKEKATGDETEQESDKSAVIDDDEDEGDDEDDDDLDISVPMTATLVLIASYIILGTVLFANWENWDYLTAAYYCFVTISTIGFGDVVPGFTNIVTKNCALETGAAALYLLIGMALMSMGFQLIQFEIAQKMTSFGGESRARLGATVDEITGESVEKLNKELGASTHHQGNSLTNTHHQHHKHHHIEQGHKGDKEGETLAPIVAPLEAHVIRQRVPFGPATMGPRMGQADLPKQDMHMPQALRAPVPPKVPVKIPGNASYAP